MTVASLRAGGFTGFHSFDALRAGLAVTIPMAAGVYAVVRQGQREPTFLRESCGGHFKGRDPTVPVVVLEQEWVPDAEVLYIGKADVLHRRLRQYADFGAGRPIGHWGGRYVWQLSDSGDLLVAWRVCGKGATVSELEAQMIARFKRAYGRLPFANIADPSTGLG
jgi:hypothetical protein